MTSAQEGCYRLAGENAIHVDEQDVLVEEYQVGNQIKDHIHMIGLPEDDLTYKAGKIRELHIADGSWSEVKQERTAQRPVTVNRSFVGKNMLINKH